LIFVGLVVVWLLILVPAVARHQQVVARPSVAALSGRVLARPVRSTEEDDVQNIHDGTHGVDDDRPRPGAAPPVEDAYDDPAPLPEDDGADRVDAPDIPEGVEDADEGWERPAPRYRPGRGGFDPEAAALTARARYVIRQRIVVGLLVVAVGTAVLALLVGPGYWWAHGLAGLALVGYLVYLRRQVRMEESIRNRRAARMAGTRRPSAADDPALDGWARRGRDVVRPTRGDRDPDRDPGHDPGHDDGYDGYAEAYEDEDDDVAELPETLDPDPDRVRGCGEPAGPLRDRPGREEQSALPRLAPAPPPPPPAGPPVIEVDLDLQELDVPVQPHRRAAG
jgi:hypothetical protein